MFYISRLLLLIVVLPFSLAASAEVPTNVQVSGQGCMVELTWDTLVPPEGEQYWVYVGSGAGQRDLNDSGLIENLSDSVYIANGMPTDGSQAFVRLWYRDENGAWAFSDATYMTSTEATPCQQEPWVVFYSGDGAIGFGDDGPAAGYLEWDTSEGSANYQVFLGTRQGRRDLFQSSLLR